MQLRLIVRWSAQRPEFATDHGFRYHKGVAAQHIDVFMNTGMDYGDLLHQHVRTGADVTLGTTPSTGRRLWAVGFCFSGAERHIFRFEEKPKDPKLLDELRISANLLKEVGRPPIPSSTRPRWASMSLIAKS